MKTATITIQYEVDGNIERNTELNALADLVSMFSGSEAYDGSDQWAIIVESINVDLCTTSNLY